MTSRERRIVAAGEKLAAQLGAVFFLDARKLRDDRARIERPQRQSDVFVEAA
jgi:hypothetical protein